MPTFYFRVVEEKQFHNCVNETDCEMHAVLKKRKEEKPMYKNNAVSISPKKRICKAKKSVKNLMNAAAVFGTYAMYQMNAFAISGLDPNKYQIKDISDFNPEGIILALAFWAIRLMGISMLIWGIYGYLTARKDGEAESMNGAIGKLVSGGALIAMPFILTELGII